MSQLKARGVEKASKAIEAKRAYVLKVTGVNNIKLLVSPQLVSKSLDVAREKLTKYPGSPRYPIRWKSRKQQIAVMIKLRESGNLPYQRTRNLYRNWKGDIETNKVVIANEARDPTTGKFYAEYVFGKDQQPFHKDTGWRQEDDTVTRDIVEPISKGIAENFIKGIAKAE